MATPQFLINRAQRNNFNYPLQCVFKAAYSDYLENKGNLSVTPGIQPTGKICLFVCVLFVCFVTPNMSLPPHSVLKAELKAMCGITPITLNLSFPQKPEIRSSRIITSQICTKVPYLGLTSGMDLEGVGIPTLLSHELICSDLYYI